MSLRRLAIGSIVLFSLSTQTVVAQPVEISVPKFDAEATIVPETTPYPDPTLAKRQVEEALATARKTHRRVMLVFGGNWCPDCRYLAGVFEHPDAATWLDTQFVIVPINIGRLDRNLDIAARYGVAVTEVPTVLLMTSNGRVLNAKNASVLGDARDLSPQNVIDQIAAWNAQN